MKKKLIIFDLDGTILDTKYDITNAVNYALYKHGFTKISINDAIKNTGKGNKNLIKQSTKIDDDIINDQVFNDFINYYNENACVLTKRYPNCLDTLVDLKRKGYKLAVFSNKHDILVQKIIKYYYDGVFDYVLGIKEGINLKPSSDGVNKIINELDSSMDETIFVGDSLVDYRTAINSGVDYMIVTYGFRTREELEVEVKTNLEDDIINIYKYL